MFALPVVVCLQFGLQALDSPGGGSDERPAPVYFIFGTAALLAALLDIRVLTRGIQGAHRIARHLWRLCFALFIAAASFFLGQAELFPEPLRNGALLAFPVLLVLFLMFFWLARVLLTGRYRRA